MFNNEFPPLGGGTATANLMLFRALARITKGLRVDLVTASPPGEPASTAEFLPGFRLHRVPAGIRDPHHATVPQLLRYAWAATRAGHLLARRVKYQAAMAWHAVPAGLAARAVCRRANIPFIIRVGGADIPGFERRFAPIYPVLTPVLRRLWSASRALVVKSQGEVDLLRRTEPALNPAVIPNGVDTEWFRPADTPRPPHSVLRIVCVARLIERKGQRHLVEAVKRLADEGIDARLTLVGGGDGRAALEQQVRDLGLAARVAFTGDISRENLPAAYQAADVFTLPSFNEGMSNAMLEAMACGLPVVVTRTPGVAEVVREGENGLTHDWADVPALAAHLRSLALDPARRAALGRAARETALTFSWDEVANVYMQIFATLAVLPAPAKSD